jgi:hypothetical protein
MQIVKTVDVSDNGEYEDKVNELLKDGFVLSSSSCGFVDSAEYEWCGVYKAVLVKTICDTKEEKILQTHNRYR